jgi:hypothetical protein
MTNEEPKGHMLGTVRLVSNAPKRFLKALAKASEAARKSSGTPSNDRP